MSEFKAPEPLKSEERELSDAMESMISMMSRMYKNQVILELNKGTVDKFQDHIKSFTDDEPRVLVNRKIRFIDGYVEKDAYDYEIDDFGDEQAVYIGKRKEPVYRYRDEIKYVNPKSIVGGDRLQFNDAQTGNYAAVLTKLAQRVQKKLLARFDDRRIKNLAKQVLAKNDARSKRLFYERVSKQMGVDPTTLLKKDGTTYDFNALVLETTQWVKKLRDETLEEYTANTLRAMTLGDSIESILQQYDGLVEKRKNHAKFTARNQVASFNSIMNKTRAQKLGITKAVWVASNDERTRPSHEWRNGRVFDLSEGLYSSLDGVSILPGAGSYQCRCSYRFILDDEETGE